MFTGLVAATGGVSAVERTDDGVRLRIEAEIAAELSAGDSVAVDGVCLTAVDADGAGFAAEVMEETLRHSALGALEPGARVNLELPLRASDRLGGHIVQGHVDGVGEVEAVTEEGFARVVRVAAPPEVLRYVVDRGSVALAGVSLTVSDVDGETLSVALIPETRERTTLGALAPGDRVNVEVDVLAKHVQKLVGERPVGA